MQIGRLAIVTTLFILTACLNRQSTPNDKIEAESIRPSTETVATGNKLVDRINEIKNLPYRTLKFKGTEIDSISWNCGDSLYWQIVALGKEAIPHLIKKIQDNSKTDVKIPCRESKLTVGTIAFMILDDIVSIPYFLVFETQWDVLDTNCDFERPVGLLEYINGHQKEAYEKLSRWYNKYRQNIKTDLLKHADQTDCQKKYGINYKLSINY